MSMATIDDHLARFANGTATRDDVQALVEKAPMDMIQIHVPRHNPPAHSKPIRLLGRSGPFSCEDRRVVHVSGPRWGRGKDRGLWAAWWRVADLRAWLATHPPNTTVLRGECPCGKKVALNAFKRLVPHKRPATGAGAALTCEWSLSLPPRVVQETGS
jgi:hypothetical protein